MRLLLRVAGLVLVVLGLYGLLTGPVYEVRKDYAFMQVHEVLIDGKKVDLTEDDLKAMGIVYEVVWVAPKGN